MASRSRAGAVRASAVACGPSAAATRTMTSAYAALARLCSAAYQNHAAPPRTRTARTAPARTRSVRREGAITRDARAPKNRRSDFIARATPSGTGARTRGTGTNPGRREARCARSADTVDSCASPRRGRARPRAPRRSPAVGRGRPPRQACKQGVTGCQARRRPETTRAPPHGRDLLQFLEKLLAQLLGFGVLALAVP